MLGVYHLYPGYHPTGHSKDQHPMKNPDKFEVTELMVEPLSRGAQLLSPSILTQAMFSGALLRVSGSGFKKGVFPDVLGSRSLIWGHWLHDRWFLRTQSPCFIVPSFALKLTFCASLLKSLGPSLMRWSGLPHPKQFQVSSGTAPLH